MHRVALIYNPVSGQRWWRRKADIEQVAAVLREAGILVEAFETAGSGGAQKLAAEAVSRGCDTVIACGGDGTVHEVLQSLVGTDVALGVIPLGTANALAANLGLACSPEKAIRVLLEAEPVRISVGRISYGSDGGVTRARFFTVAAGVGPDALLLSRLDAGLKRRLGYLLYLVEAMRLWATYSFPLFEAAFEERSNQARRVEQVSQLIAVRIRDFGGVLHELAPGATLRSDRLRLVAFKTKSRIEYLRFLLAVVMGRPRFTSRIELLDAISVECNVGSDAAAHVFAEADGELLGELPVRIEVVQEAVKLMVPRNARP